MRPFNLNAVVHPVKCKGGAYLYYLSCKEIFGIFIITQRTACDLNRVKTIW